MSHKEYYEATFEQLGYRIAAYIEEKEANTINMWEVARQQAFWILAPHLKKGSSVTSLGTFEWEKQEIDWESMKGLFAKLPKPKA